MNELRTYRGNLPSQPFDNTTNRYRYRSSVCPSLLEQSTFGIRTFMGRYYQPITMDYTSFWRTIAFTNGNCAAFFRTDLPPLLNTAHLVDCGTNAAPDRAGFAAKAHTGNPRFCLESIAAL